MSDLEETGVRLVVEGEEAYKRSMQAAQDSVDKFTGDLSGTQTQRVGTFQAAMAGAFAGITSAAIDMAAQAGKAVVGFVTDSIGSAGDFEQGMSVLKAASGASEEEMKSLSATAIALGNDITLPATSAKSAAEAMTELVKAGLSVEDSQNAAKGALQLATAAQIDEATAASIVAGALNTFHLEGSKATEIADMLSAGANASAASATDMADGFKQAGFAFEANNQDADDLITALSLLTNVGLTGSDAGTALKNAMMKLAAPTDQGAKLMEQLGINVFDAQGKMKPMNEIIGIFNGALAGMTDEQRNATLNTVFMSDGMKAMIPLLDAGTSGFDAMNAKVNEQGAAAKMAGAQTEGLKGAQAALANTMDTLQLIIGTALLPVITDLLNNYIIPGAKWVSDLVTQFINASTSGEGIGATLSEMIPGFDGVMAVVSDLKVMFEAALPAITSVINGIRDVIFAIFGEVKKFLDEHGDEIKQIMEDAWEVIQLAIDTAVMYYKEIVAPALEAIAKWIREHSAEIQRVFKFAWDAIKLAIDTVLTLIKGILTAAMQVMQGDTEGALNTLRDTFETIWDKIRDAVLSIVNALANALKTKFDEIKNSIANALKGAYDALVAQLNAWVQLGASIITSIIDGITSQATALFNQIRDTIMGAIRGAINLFPAFLRPALLAFFGLGSVQGQGFKGSSVGASSFTSYGNTYNLSVSTTASASVVMDSYAVMAAFG